MFSRLKSKIMSNSVPRHLRKSGDDGYRTPTIEDPEHPAHHGVDTAAFASALSHGIDDLVHTPSHVRCTHHHFGHNPHYCHRRDHSDELPFEPPKNLSWKQRIKHVTWAYFTVTMATGGIANVLSTGIADCMPLWVILRANILQSHSDSTDLRQLASSSSY
jgi:hypothetical protein